MANNIKCDHCRKELLESNGIAWNPKTGEKAHRGWTNAVYCSLRCDEAGYIACCSSMPGAGRCRSVPPHVKSDMNRRWSHD